MAAEVELPLAGPIATGTIPVPERLTLCGLFTALSAMVRVPVRGPVVVGVSITEIWQLPFTARVAPQVFVSVKSPDVAIEAILRIAVPELVTVTVCPGLELPSAMLPKARLVPETAAAGTAGLMVKVSADEVPPPGVGVVTVTWAVPEATTSDAGTTAVSWVALT